MKYKVKKDKEKKDEFVEFWVEQFEPGHPIELKARHSSWPKDQDNHILAIYEDGHVKLSMGINLSLGLELDRDGRILLEKRGL